MAGRGPQPKDVEKRARTNVDPLPLRVLPRVLSDQPVLPEFEYTQTYRIDGETHSEVVPWVWPDSTRQWWQMWADSPLSVDFTSTDWFELLDSALLHARVWQGDLKWLPELRLRTAKFGATPEDRARLRIQFAQATDAEITTAKKVLTSTDRFANVGVTSMDPDVAS